MPRELFLPYIPGHVPDADGKQASHITMLVVVTVWVVTAIYYSVEYTLLLVVTIWVVVVAVCHFVKCDC